MAKYQTFHSGRNNNRKSTRGRHIQEVKLDSGRTKVIKHFK